jgi:CrcB protein
MVVALGGSLGAVARYQIGLWGKDLHSDFPFTTLLVNVLGSLLFGIAFYFIVERAMFSESARLLVLVGFLGAFTTFSTFSFELFELIQKGAWLYAFGSLCANVFLSFIALSLAYLISKQLFQ